VDYGTPPGINRHIDADNRIHSCPLTPPPAQVLKGPQTKGRFAGRRDRNCCISMGKFKNS
jgi:hypothetical protein